MVIIWARSLSLIRTSGIVRESVNSDSQSNVTCPVRLVLGFFFDHELRVKNSNGWCKYLVEEKIGGHFRGDWFSSGGIPGQMGLLHHLKTWSTVGNSLYIPHSVLQIPLG